MMWLLEPRSRAQQWAPFVVLALVVLLAGWWAREHWKQDEAVQGERVSAEATRRAPLIVEKLTLDTVYRRDTLRFRTAVTRYDTARVTDTVVRDSVVYVNREVADGALRACSAVVLTCEKRVANSDSIAASWERSFNARTAELVSVRRRGRVEKVGYLLAGYGLAKLEARVWP